MRAAFIVQGEPEGKGRPRFSTVNGHSKPRTPDGTVLYENLVKTEYQRQCNNVRFPDDAVLRVSIIAYCSIPKSASKRRQMNMMAGIIRPAKKPDTDNIAKVICDSLNQIAYHDDAQIAELLVRKFYDSRPRVVVSIQDFVGGKV